ncbi:hypothetical protein LCGC14_0849650, partial [marine sediment metagenome]
HDEIHELVQELAHTSGQSMLAVTQEALQLYKEHLQGKDTQMTLVNKFLEHVGEDVIGKLSRLVHNKVLDAIRDILPEIEAAQRAEKVKHEEALAQLIQTQSVKTPSIPHPDKPWLGKEDPIAEDYKVICNRSRTCTVPCKAKKPHTSDSCEPCPVKKEAACIECSEEN